MCYVSRVAVYGFEIHINSHDFLSIPMYMSGLQMLMSEMIGKHVKKIRVYGQGRIEIDLLSNDSFITELLELASKTAV